MQIQIGMATSFGEVLEFWAIGDRRCVLGRLSGLLEVRLYEEAKLIGLQPCASGTEALEIAERWAKAPPAWPPF